MLKVLIVDDEYYFRESLKYMIDWKTLGYHICGEASNGQDAIKMVEAKRPDVILLDINMPIINGLVLAERVKQLDIQIKIIIITGYNDFEYAKQAIKLNVYQYISKPIEEKELIECLIEIKELKMLESTHTKQLESLKKEARLKYYHQLLYASRLSSEEQQIKETLEQFQCHLIGNNYQIALITINRTLTLKWQIEDEQLLYFAMLNILGELDMNFSHVEFLHEEERHIVILISRDCQENQCIECLRRAVATIEDLLKLRITFSLGSAHKKINELNLSYKNAILGLKNQMLLDSKSFITNEEVSGLSRIGSCYSIEERRTLMMLMQSKDLSGIEQMVSKVFVRMQEKKMNYDLYMRTCSELYSTCMEYLVKNDVAIKANNFYDQSKFLKKISHIEILDYVKREIIELLIEAVQIVKNKHMNLYSDVVQAILKYIHENYRDENLSVKYISDNLYVNYGHLCRVFKREIGITINDYIINYRMEQAKELFHQGNKVIYYVAKNVGYSDANYFSKCFKKATGFTPSHYIEYI